MPSASSSSNPKRPRKPRARTKSTEVKQTKAKKEKRQKQEHSLAEQIRDLEARVVKLEALIEMRVKTLDATE